MPQLPHRPLAALLCAALAGGCASGPEPLAPELRQRLGKVYLNSAGPTGETFFHADAARNSALKSAGQGAMNGLDTCLGDALGSGGLAPLVFVVCAPILVPAGMVKESAAANTTTVPDETLDALEQQTNALLQDADLAPALVATLDEESQKNRALASYEISHGTLPEPANNASVREVAAKWDYQTLIEIQVTKAGFESDKGRVPMMHFSMTAQVKLIETDSGSVLQEQEYHYDSKPQPFKYWFTEDHRLLVEEIVKGNKALAYSIINDVFIK